MVNLNTTVFCKLRIIKWNQYALRLERVNMDKLLKMENLERHYETPAGVVKALDGVTFEILEGERVKPNLVAAMVVIVPEVPMI